MKGRGSLHLPSCHRSYYRSICADAVISLSNKATVVHAVSTTIFEFIARWVQSFSGYDSIVASTMTPDWARAHMPVISLSSTQHVMYTAWDVARPHGQNVVCWQECNARLDKDIRANTVRLTCSACKAKTTVPKVLPRRDTALGKRSLVKVAFPVPKYPAEWEIPARLKFLALKNQDIGIPSTLEPHSTPVPVPEVPSLPPPQSPTYQQPGLPTCLSSATSPERVGLKQPKKRPTSSSQDHNPESDAQTCEASTSGPNPVSHKANPDPEDESISLTETFAPITFSITRRSTKRRKRA